MHTPIGATGSSSYVHKRAKLNIDHYHQEVQKTSQELIDKTSKYFLSFKENLVANIEYYQELATKLSSDQKEKFLKDLEELLNQIESNLPEIPTALSLVPIK